MFVRILTPGWETFTGSLGHQATFKDGVSTIPLNARQIARIGSSLKIVDVETGQQVGPSSVLASIQSKPMEVAPVTRTDVEVKADEAQERDRLAAQLEARKAADAAALAEAQRKAEDEVADIVIYSRAELEAIGANNGISGLREIATPLGVRGRGIGELVTEILTAQAKQAVA